MSATISTKKGNIGMAYLKRTAGLIQGAAGEYFRDAMPVTDSVLSGATATIASATSKLANTQQSVFPKLRQLKSQATFKNINNWFLTQENDLDGGGDFDASMSFDIEDLDDAGIAEAQISEWDKNANKVSKSVVESSHKMVEAQMVSTANIASTLDKQTAVISAGFDSTNKLLGQILEVMTKNTATLIEATVAASEQKSAKDEMLSRGKFNMGNYKKVLAKNFEESELAPLMAMSQMLSGGTWKQFATPETIVSGLFNVGLNKAAPNLKKNMKALDEAVNSVIMTSLIRLGENQSFGIKGIMSRLFGIDPSRKNVDTSRSSLQIKSVSWDTVARESLTNAIPGYLREMVKLMGGPDMVYDYRSRTFRTQKAIAQDFQRAVTSTGNLSRSSARVRDGLLANKADSQDMQMFYDLMMSDLAANHPGGSQREFIKGLKSERQVAEYIRTLTGDMELSRKDLKSQDQFIKNLAKMLRDEWSAIDVSNQAASSEVNRRIAGENYVKVADNYNIDLSGLSDDPEQNRRTIISQYGRKLKAPKGSASVREESVSALKGLSGTDYTNRALYEIYRRLDRGINVFKVGELEQLRREHYPKMNRLKPPEGYRPPSGQDKDDSKGTKAVISGVDPGKYDDGTNLLKNNEQEDGSTEELTKGQRFSRWGKNRGKQFAGAMFSGSPDEVKAVFAATIKDIADATGGEFKKGINKINSSFGNVSGYLKHKMFGSEYSYEDTDENGNKVTKTIAKNEGGGLFGFISKEFVTMFSNAKEKAGNWMKEVSSYFDYGDKDEDAEIVSKRKKLIGASIGAFAGAGLLGGPIGMLVGGIAGNAITSFGFGKKIKDFLFGVDKESGKPTGLLTKAADAIVSPIQFQVGKTVAFASAMVKKNILGPLSDIGLAVKDRITNHVDSMFESAKKAVLAPFKKVGMWIGKGLAKAATGMATLGSRASTTMTGKLVRAAIGGGTGSIGFLQNMTARKLSKNSFHKLKKGELYALRVGERYYDPSEETEDSKNQRSMVHILDDSNPRVQNLEELQGGRGVLLNGDDPKEWRPYSRDYIKRRRKDRNKSIDETMRESGFYGQGGVRGFFGGDYKKWHNDQYGKRAEAMQRLDAAMSETLKEQSESTQEIADTSAEIRDVLREEQIPGSSFKTHDQGLWDRVDIIIKTLTGIEAAQNSDGTIKKEPKKSESKDAAKKDAPTGGAVLNGEKIVDALKSNSENNERDSFATAGITAATSMAISGDTIGKDESNVTASIIDEAGKPESSKKTISAKLKELMGLQKKKKDEENGEKKETIFDKILGALGSGFSGMFDKLGIIGAAIGGLLAIDELKSLWDNVIKGDMNFAEWWGEESKIGKAIQGLMDISSFIGRVGSPVVNAMSKGIETVTGMVPFMPTISPPQIDGEGPFAGLATGILGGLYLKGIGAIGSVASAAASIVSAGSNALGNLGGGGSWKTKLLKTGAVALAGYSYLKGPEIHENTDAAGNEIVDEDKTRAMRMPGTRVVVNSAIDALSNRAATAGANRAMASLADAGITASMNQAGRVTFHQGNRFATNAAVEAATGMAKSDAAELAAKALANNADEVATSKGAMGFVKKAIEGIKNFLMKNKTFAKFAKTISTKLDDVLIAIGKGADSVIAKMPQKIAGIITKGGTKEAAGVATAGIGYAVMAFGGALSGGLSAANIFGVRESDVNATMRTVASVVVAMLNAVPGLWALELADLFIAPMTMRGIICQLLYGLLGGKEDLLDKQATFSEDLSSYNETYGAQLSTDEYNDMVNKGMFAKIFGKGAVKTDAEGRAMFDEAGEAIRTNHGFAGWFSGGQKVYAHNEDGSVMRDENGKAIQAVDKYGKGIVENKTWTDHVGDFFGSGWRWLAGGKEYETDENGQAIRDADGNLVEKGSTGNIFQRGGAAIADWWGGKEIENPDGTKTRTGGFKEAATKTLGNIGATIAKPFQEAASGVKDWWSGSVELDEKGQPILDENGQPIRKGGFKKMAGETIGKFGSAIANVGRGVKATVTDWVMGEYERDEDGNPLLDEEGNPIRKGGLAGWVKGGLGKLNESFVQPAKEMINGAKEWVKDKAEWVQEGLGTAGAWIAEKAGNMWNAISTPVKDFAKGAKDWAGNAASWLGDKASDAGAWISEKASSMWTAISTPVKDAAKSASDWVKDKAEWVTDKAKSAGAWIADKASNIFGAITDNVKSLSDGAKDWVKDKAEWVKDGVKSAGDWISKKAKGIWDWITQPIKDLEERGEQEKKDSDYISSRGGGTGGPVVAGVGGGDLNDIWDRGSMSSAERQAASSNSNTVTEGGNPLNKPFRVTSSFGPRSYPHTGNHNGVDLVPSSGSGPTLVGSRFSGTVTGVKSNVSDSDTAKKGSSGWYYPGSNSTGNMVTIQTDSGLTVKNMHLKAGSIPSSIKVGAKVKPGDLIGTMGSTGWSTGAHLHYQLEKNGKPFDPINSVKGGSTMSDFTTDGTFDTSGTSDGTSSNGAATLSDMANGKTGIAGVIEVLKSLGTAILNKITGGLFGSSSSSSTSSIAGDGSLDGAMSIEGSKVSNVDEFLRLCAAEIGTCENPANSNRVKYNTWFYGKEVSGSAYPWCMAFVQWCFHQAGLDLECKTAGCGTLLNHYQQNHPNLVFKAGTGTPKPGDIALFGDHDHTGIIEKVASNTSITTIEGNTSGGGSQDNGGCVMRKTRSTSGAMPFTYYIRAVDFEGLKNMASPGNIEGDEAMYKYLRSIGYSPEAAVAIIACWAHESANGPKRVEADYLNIFKQYFGGNYDNVGRDYATFNKYTEEVIRRTPRANPDGYKAKDGRKYAGLGYAQWTADRSKALLDFAKKNNARWYDSGTQLAFMDQEMHGSFSGTYNKLKSASNITDATHAFAYGYEHGKMPSDMYQARLKTAKELYPKLKNINVAGGVGGPMEISPNQNLHRPEDEAPQPNFSDAAVGGPSDMSRATSSIGRSKWIDRPAGGPADESEVSTMTSGTKLQPRTLRTTYSTPTEGPVSSTGDLDTVISLMSRMLGTLIDIKSNTGSSSDLLGSLNEKDFIDKELRDTLTAAGKVSKKRTSRHTGSSTNASQVVALARP